MRGRVAVALLLSLGLLLVAAVASSPDAVVTTGDPGIDSPTEASVDGARRAERRVRRSPATAPRATTDETETTPVAIERELRIVTANGTPVPACVVHWSVADGPGGTTLTEVDGTFVVITASEDAPTVRIGDSKTVHTPSSAGAIVLPDAKRIELVAVDSRTDEPVGRTSVATGGERLETDQVLAVDGLDGCVTVETPRGIVPCLDALRRLDCMTPDCRVARGYRLVLPTRPEVVLPVRISGVTGDAAPAVSVLRTDAFGWRDWSQAVQVARDPDDPAAWVGTAERLPFLYGEWITAQAIAGDLTAFHPHRLRTPGAQPTANLAVHSPVEEEVRSAPWHGGRFGRGCRMRREPGAVVVRALLRDGRPAAGVDIWPVGRTDENGIARHESLSSGPWSFAFREPGVVPSTTTVDIVAGETTYVDLHERQGRTITLETRAEDGTALPYARVKVRQPSQVDYVRIDHDGIADLVLWTDSAGRITLPNLEESTIRLTVSFGTRTVHGRVRPGKTHAVAVLPDAPRPARPVPDDVPAVVEESKPVEVDDPEW